ncbi:MULTISPECIES: aminomethyltransferase family protein [Haloarcula]|uniref:Glycine cleavage system protein T n=1 Tax=Haloarcula pellucida TaxID=1427151 RepID=A0A830GSY2_9EURY|nr:MULTISPECIES: aminomethyltransferase family protein [Halomicroarcula]MBX0350086.1 aminomethyltransferase family protein [Halomicroarcula pellucida]MDS0277812.1 aminomethyltransferase family protein [Halomicroarcula sp. S1AR25-4]GGO00357.1 glycine cleavage system protein T [Halomicroarcula pellucida]
MTVLEEVHAAHEATFREVGGRRVVDTYGRPERTHRAVRNVVGVCEFGYGVLVVTGADRVEYVDNAVSNRVPDADGQGCYALLLDPQGRVETDMYVYNAGERLLVFTPPQEATALAEEWQEKTFIQDVDVRVATDDFATFGVHGPKATEKIASVLHQAASPEAPLSFNRGELGDVGVSVIRTDNLAGEESYDVVCAAEDAEPVFDTLVNRGLNAVPFGYRTWETLTMEAGSPLFDTEIEGHVPNELGLRNALDFDKGCYVGQEVVSRIENRGHPPSRLVGLAVDELPDAGAAVFAGDEHVGEVTRATNSPMREAPIAMAAVDWDLPDAALTVRVDGEGVEATRTDLPFVEGSAVSARLPSYE